jgi:hypothetical protein
MALGNVAPGSVEIGPITPDHSTTSEALRGIELEKSETLHIKTTGPTGDLYYSIASVKMDRALRWMITASPVAADANL